MKTKQTKKRKQIVERKTGQQHHHRFTTIVLFPQEKGQSSSLSHVVAPLKEPPERQNRTGTAQTEICISSPSSSVKQRNPKFR